MDQSSTGPSTQPDPTLTKTAEGLLAAWDKDRGYETVDGKRAISLTGHQAPVPARHPWGMHTFVQGGERGLVVSDKGSYVTAFVEACSDAIGFVRGEGTTLAEAEDDCWAQAQRIASCPGPRGHEYEPRNYRNGGGICRLCGKFGAKVFTPEQLGLYCADCGIPTFWHQAGDVVYCPEHVPHDPDAPDCYCKECTARWVVALDLLDRSADHQKGQRSLDAAATPDTH